MTKNPKRPGAPLGNKNATKTTTAKLVSIRLYPSEKDLVKAIAGRLEINQSEAIRWAIKRLARELGIQELPK